MTSFRILSENISYFHSYSLSPMIVMIGIFTSKKKIQIIVKLNHTTFQTESMVNNNSMTILVYSILVIAF
jgi:hypothetical protein